CVVPCFRNHEDRPAAVNARARRNPTDGGETEQPRRRHPVRWAAHWPTVRRDHMNALLHPDPATLLARQHLALDMIERGEPLGETLSLLCHIVEAEASVPVRASILLVDHDANCLRTGAAPGLPDRYNRAVDGI